MDESKRQFAELLAYDTLESTRTSLEAFADAFERLARGPKQRALADEFSGFVADYVRQPLSMADLNGLIGLGHWLEVYASKFKQLGGRAEFKELVEGLERFKEDCIAAHERWSRSGQDDVQYPTLPKGMVQELLRDIQELTGRHFVYEDGWCGFVPAGEVLTELQTGPPERFADLHWRDQADVLREFISWDHYAQRGLGWRDRDAIRTNVLDGKPPDRRLEGTSFAPTAPALAEQFQEMLGQSVERSATTPEKEPPLPADPWQYRIAPHRKRPGEFTWEPATDGTADTWFLFGEKGEDRRCFGVFSSRAGAEQALEVVRNRQTERHKDRGIDR
jgi:hypothetical protein